jgi:hypothetical protein
LPGLHEGQGSLFADSKRNVSSSWVTVIYIFGNLVFLASLLFSLASSPFLFACLVCVVCCPSYPQTKHIAIQHYWVQEKIAEQEVDLQYIETNRQVADSLTKVLPKDTFEAFQNTLGLERV